MVFPAGGDVARCEAADRGREDVEMRLTARAPAVAGVGDGKELGLGEAIVCEAVDRGVVGGANVRDFHESVILRRRVQVF